MLKFWNLHGEIFDLPQLLFFFTTLYLLLCYWPSLSQLYIEYRAPCYWPNNLQEKASTSKQESMFKMEADAMSKGSSTGGNFGGIGAAIGAGVGTYAGMYWFVPQLMLMLRFMLRQKIFKNF